MELNGRHNGDSSNHRKKPRIITSILSDSEIQSEFSHHQTGIARINNGSFGCCPTSILNAQREYQLKYLRQPDEFYFNSLRPGLLASRTVIANLINADDVDEISLVDNATTAAAIVLQRVGRCFTEGKYSKDDTVVMFNCAFQSVKKSIQAYVSRVGGLTVEVKLPFPVNSNEEILSAFRKGLEKGKANGRTVRLAILDHITSMPCVLLPVKELVKICREEGVGEVFVDAAHAIGSVKVDVKEIGADYYVSNLHKWFFCPPSIAFFYCKKKRGEDVHHPVVSHEFGNGLAIESSWIGTRDYSSQLVVPSVMEFVERFEGGIDGIMMRNHDEAVRMGLMIANAWGTNLGSPSEMCVGMVMIALPSRLCVGSDDDGNKLRTCLRVKYSVEVPVYFLGLRDGEEESVRDGEGGVVTAYVRISHQVYNKTEDYEQLRDAVIELVNDRMTCGNLPIV